MRRGAWLGAVAASLLLATPAHAIIDGHPPTREYPWFAHVQRIAWEAEDDTGCGGSLVAPRWVLTAAHCMMERLDGTVDPIDPGDIRIMFGRTRRHVPPPYEQRGAKRIVVHPDYTPFGDPLAPAGGPDMALIELREDVPFETIAIPGEKERHLWRPGVEGTVIGFGITERTPVVDLFMPVDPERSSDVLLEAQVPIVRDEDCARSWLVAGMPVGFRFDPKSMLCAGRPQGGPGGCNYDSGGPLMVGGPGNSLRLVGVVSFGPCSYPLLYEVYARPAEPAMRSWVLRTIGT